MDEESFPNRSYLCLHNLYSYVLLIAFMQKKHIKIVSHTKLTLNRGEQANDAFLDSYINQNTA